MNLSRIAFATSVLCASALFALDIKLTVTEPAGVARVAEPVSGGIPLPEGQFKKDQPFAVFDGDKEIPAQVLPMVVTEAGFVRWLLVDFQTDLPAKGTRVFSLKDVKPTASPAKAIKVDGAAGGDYTVNTGVAEFVLSPAQPSLFRSISAGGKPVVTGGAIHYTDGFSGKTYTADKPKSIEVEYTGPMRVTLCVRGGFVGDDTNKFGWVARVTAWAGKSELLVKYSLCNSNPDHYSYRLVTDSTIELKLAGAAGALVGTPTPVEAPEASMTQSGRVNRALVHNKDSCGDAPWLHRTLGAAGPGGAKVVGDGKDLWVSQGKADQSQGWIAAKCAAGLLRADDLYFVEDPPRKLAVTKDCLVLSGIAEPIDNFLPFAGKGRWLFDCSHLSSQYLLDVAAKADAPAERAKALRRRVWVMADPSWYFVTEQLPVGKFGTQADELKCYELWGWKYDPKAVPTGPADVMSAVPRWVGGDDNHFTSEQDTADALILMYLRTGKRSFFDAAEAWVNYFADLQTWRTDGWRWKDGGGWWAKRGKGGPLGNNPVRKADPVTGERNYILGAYSGKKPFGGAGAAEMFFLANAKACHCHNWGEGLTEWFMLTGDRDVFDAAIDTVENHADTQLRAFGKAPGKGATFSRDFTRASYLTNAARLIAPTDPFVIEASDKLAAVFLRRPNKEPRGFLNAPGRMELPGPAPKPASLPANWDQAAEDTKVLDRWIAGFAGPRGLAEMKAAGVTVDPKTGLFSDPKTGAKWYPLGGAHTWMYPPLSRAMELYYRQTGNEDALDWLIAYGQSSAYILFQPKHGCLDYGSFVVDFPVKGVAKDISSWLMADECPNGEGKLVGADGKPVLDAKGNPRPVSLNGYLAMFQPDVVARAYGYCGEEFLKQRAYDYWFWGSHRDGAKTVNVGQVAVWSNIYNTHKEHVCFIGRLFYEASHPRTDAQAPEPVADLAVTAKGNTAQVSFTAPADRAGGKVVRYQLKCADKLVLDYQAFLRAWAANEDSARCNWWMAANMAGEPAPAKAGEKVSFEVTGVPAGVKYFALVSFDDSNNRSAISNVPEAK